MVQIPKLDLTGFTAVLAGFIFLATGLLLLFNSSNTLPDPVNPGILRLLGAVTALVGILLLISRDE
jgi:hypothetical protein